MGQTMDIRPLVGTFAAEVVEVDLNVPLGSPELERLKTAFVEHHVLVSNEEAQNKDETISNVSLAWRKFDQRILAQSEHLYQ